MLSASVHSKLFVAILILTFGIHWGCKGKQVSPKGRDCAIDAIQADSPPATHRLINLDGRVVDRRRVPLPDVLIIAWPKGKHGQSVAQARSGDDGRFILPGLQADRWKLLVEAASLGTLDTERQVPEDGSVELMLESESRSLSGLVTDTSGRPQSGADVTLGSPGLRWLRNARSDLNGNFVIGGLGSGRFTLRATMGQQASASAVVLLEEATLRPAHVRLSLQPGVFVAGQVHDDNGNALANAIVDIMAMPSDDLPVSGKSGREGQYQLGPIAPGKYQVLARLEGYILFDAPEPYLGARKKEFFDLRLARTARVVGRVLDESANPIVGTQVSAISLVGGKDDLVVIPGPLPLAAEAAELPVGRLFRPGGVRSSPTDKSGTFVITGLSPGRTRIEILHPQKLPFRREPLLLAPGDARDLGDLTMLTGAILAGKVFNDQGQIAAGAEVEARLGGKSSRHSLRATTDGNGDFFLRVPLGEYALAARTSLLSTKDWLQVQVQKDVPIDSCVLRLSPRPAGPLGR
jgi:hypothetical protein